MRYYYYFILIDLTIDKERQLASFVELQSNNNDLMRKVSQSALEITIAQKEIRTTREERELLAKNLQKSEAELERSLSATEDLRNTLSNLQGEYACKCERHEQELAEINECLIER